MGRKKTTIYINVPSKPKLFIGAPRCYLAANKLKNHLSFWWFLKSRLTSSLLSKTIIQFSGELAGLDVNCNLYKNT